MLYSWLKLTKQLKFLTCLNRVTLQKHTELSQKKTSEVTAKHYHFSTEFYGHHYLGLK